MTPTLIAALSLLAPATSAPPGTPATLYCMTTEQFSGTHLLTIECRTRVEWAAFDVDVDKEWAEHGDHVIQPRG